MRILSQDGTIDLPYECIGITIVHRGDNEEFYIFAHLVNSAEPKKEPQKLGTYSTETKAQKAMEMLRETYTGMPIVMQNVDFSEDMAKEFERLKKCGIIVRAENQPSKVDFISNDIFQFPQDDEIEVLV